MLERIASSIHLNEWQNTGESGNGKFRGLLFNDLFEHQFVGRILKRIKKTNRARFNAHLEESPYHLPGFFWVEGFQDTSITPDPLIHFESEPPRDQRRGKFSEDVI